MCAHCAHMCTHVAHIESDMCTYVHTLEMV
jgi:hypothetical protein